MKIQETPEQLKPGSVPRSLNIQVRGNIAGDISPGDIVVVDGVLLPIRKKGFQHQNDLLFDCYLDAYKMRKQKKKYIDMSIDEEAKEKINKVRQSTDDNTLFEKLAKSIAPEIYGLESVKKALLLMMAGGVTKETSDLLKIRGEINVALIG